MPDCLSRYRYLLAFGSNISDRSEHCQKGLDLLRDDVFLIKSSRRINTLPLSLNGQVIEQDDYLNFVVDAASDLMPDELYKKIVSIEDLIGHRRDRRWQPRELDIDILFFARNSHLLFGSCDLLAFEKNRLVVPHEGFWQRPFLQDLVAVDLQIPLAKLRIMTQKSP